MFGLVMLGLEVLLTTGGVTTPTLGGGVTFGALAFGVEAFETV